MRIRILKCGCAAIAGSIFIQTLAPICPHGNDPCEMQVEPPHVPQEVSVRDTFTVTSPVGVSGSNVHVGIQHVKLAADIRSPKT